MTDNPYMRRKTKHEIGHAGRKSEQRLARELGGRLRPASGAMVGAKGDLEIGKLLLEAKSTTQASMGLKLSWLLKIADEARREAKTPALALSFVRETGEPLMDGEWACIPMPLFREFMLDRGFAFDPRDV